MFDCQQQYSLENEVVLLRPLGENDYEYLVTFSINEPELWFYSLVPADSEANLKTYIHSALNGRKESKEYPFIVFDKRTGKYAGSTRFYDIQLQHKTLQLGYTWYGKAFQGTGLNKNAKYLLLQFAFETIGVERVEFRADHNNKRSINAMKAIGCIEEGVLRSNCVAASGIRRDSIVLSILSHEWFSSVKAQLQNQL
ncbi:MAG: GNAT family N-acetyltransferase [Chitinophagales bacterium]|nr:GNAT family N-acetyltransferase [Chitinophagales bacterium]